ncbi:hypothetical protein HY990_02465 [Candidatus Micrarchaeota archaeon]|nr:hypothetical protein [Candidatus Micrarchaeota archaeon]
MERNYIKSGIPGLDSILGGGVIENSIVTVSGPTGSGKSTLGMQFIYKGAMEENEPGLYISIEETRGDFLFHMSGYKWDLGKLEKERKLIFLDYPVHEVDQILSQNSAVQGIISSTGAKRVVIDSIMPVALYFANDDDRKRGFVKFIENLRRWNVTTLLLTQDAEDNKQRSSHGIETFTDGWINFFYKFDEKTMERTKYIEVVKMKGSVHSTKAHMVKIDENGISIGETRTNTTPAAVPAPSSPTKQKPEKEEKPAVKKLILGPAALKKEKAEAKESEQKENIAALKKKLMAVRTKLLSKK